MRADQSADDGTTSVPATECPTSMHTISGPVRLNDGRSPRVSGVRLKLHLPRVAPARTRRRTHKCAGRLAHFSSLRASLSSGAPSNLDGETSVCSVQNVRVRMGVEQWEQSLSISRLIENRYLPQTDIRFNGQGLRRHSLGRGSPRSG